MERGQRAKVKGMPLLVCRPKPKRGKRGGSPGAKPKRTTARLLFERKARKDMHGKFGGKEAFASSLHVVDLQITSKKECRAFALRTMTDMWLAAPESVRGLFEYQAKVVNDREGERFAEQQQQQQQQQQGPQQHSRQALQDMTGGHEDGGDGENGRTAPSAAASNSGGEGQLLVLSRVARPRGATAPRGANAAVGRASRPAAAGGTAQTKKDGDHRWTEKQRASKPVPLVSRSALGLENMDDDPAVGAGRRPPTSAPTRYGSSRGLARSAQETQGASSSETPASAEAKSPRVANGRSGGRADDRNAKDSGEPDGRKVRRSPKSPGKRVPVLPDALAGSKAKPRRKAKINAVDKATRGAEKGAGLPTVTGKRSPRSSKTLAAGAASGQAPPETTPAPGRRAATSGGRGATASGASKAVRKRRAFASATTTAKLRKRTTEAEASALKGKPGGSTSRIPCCESPAGVTTTARGAQRESPRFTGPTAKPNTADGRATPGGQADSAARGPAVSAMTALTAPNAPVSSLAPESANGGAATATGRRGSTGKGSVGGKRNASAAAAATEGRGWGVSCVPEYDQSDRDAREANVVPEFDEAGSDARGANLVPENGQTESDSDDARGVLLGTERDQSNRNARGGSLSLVPEYDQSDSDAQSDNLGAEYGQPDSDARSVSLAPEFDQYGSDARGGSFSLAPGFDQADSVSDSDTWPEGISSDEAGLWEEEEDEFSSSDDESEDESEDGSSGGHGGGWAGRAGGAAGTIDDTAAAEMRETHKRKVWHAGRREPLTMFGLPRQKKAEIEVLWDVERRPSGTMEKIWMTASVDLIDMMNRVDEAVKGPLWNIFYERHRTIPASKSQVVFVSKNRLRDMLEWDKEEQRWMGDPLPWRPKKGGET